MSFPVGLEEIQARIKSVDPQLYAKTRNYKNGAVTKLSPYISRGVVSTKQLFLKQQESMLPFQSIEKYVQELAWRDFWQHTWKRHGSAINQDFKYQQENVQNQGIPKSILTASTGIEAIDKAIIELQETGYMHNHMRMYVASIVCNVAKCHWLEPARWMYSLLLDGDWASNALSWQWVAGSNSNKKYYANQENINKYFFSTQRDTFLDKTYEELSSMPVPNVLRETTSYHIGISFPKSEKLEVDPSLKTLIYNYYNLDPNWHQGEECSRILILDPSFLGAYPINQRCLDFSMDLSRNIDGIQLFVGSFKELSEAYNLGEVCYKEHPTNHDYIGQKEPRDWIFDLDGDFGSFFKYWKSGLKSLR